MLCGSDNSADLVASEEVSVLVAYERSAVFNTIGSSDLCVEKILQRRLIVLFAEGEVSGTTSTHSENALTKTKK